MKLKLDENLSRHLKLVLTTLEHDTLTAADENLLSRPDAEIERAASREERMLLTLDVEFADLRKYPPGLSSRHHPVPPALGKPVCRGFRSPQRPGQVRRLRCLRRSRTRGRPPPPESRGIKLSRSSKLRPLLEIVTSDRESCGHSVAAPQDSKRSFEVLRLLIPLLAFNYSFPSSAPRLGRKNVTGGDLDACN